MKTNAIYSKTFSNINQAIEYIINTDYTVNTFNYFVRELEENNVVDLGNVIVYIDDTKTE